MQEPRRVTFPTAFIVIGTATARALKPHDQENHAADDAQPTRQHHEQTRAAISQLTGHAAHGTVPEDADQ